MFLSYLRMLVFAFGILMGVQYPAFVDLYYQRIHAHYIEAQQNLAGFEQTARQFFAGDIDALIRHYRESDDPVFVRDADNIQRLVTRVRVLQAENQYATAPWFKRDLRMFSQADAAIRQETLRNFSYVVPLTPKALAWGMTLGLLLSLVLDIIGALFKRLLLPQRENKALH